ncbi:alpha/beta hydrolase [Flavobacterium sp. IMCC34852]|uniref:Alpha/beta hydrolase n=1 Tax=Flavobacterium rivulicola TaxID=2732161 RepID=A0A7Y3R8D4_9FLAO|nr:alpha/beta fold hydrolase [Flavobacterium sp. IMCC34852]NNT71757.1 alpha/beta hydrolase [Flavobacterium sp. IMCC34852]
MKKINYFLITKSVGLYINLLSFFYPEKAKEIAYTIFSQPRKGKIKSGKLPKTLQSAQQETLHYDGEDFQTYIWQGSEDSSQRRTGQSQIILLLHGWESNASRWKKLLNQLKPTGKTIIAIDAPGHGLSSGKEFNAPRYAEFIHILAQKYNPKTLIGHSIGGAAITYYLHKYPNDHIEKIVLLGTPSSFKKISDNFVNILSLNNKMKNLLEKHYQEKFDIHINDFAGHLFAKNFAQKAIIAHDINDKVILVEEGRMYASSWKNSTYIETQGLGHSMHDKDLYQKIVHFITEA